MSEVTAEAAGAAPVLPDTSYLPVRIARVHLRQRELKQSSRPRRDHAIADRSTELEQRAARDPRSPPPCRDVASRGWSGW